jgi:hypothetical protein
MTATELISNVDECGFSNWKERKSKLVVTPAKMSLNPTGKGEAQ